LFNQSLQGADSFFARRAPARRLIPQPGRPHLSAAIVLPAPPARLNKLHPAADARAGKPFS